MGLPTGVAPPGVISNPFGAAAAPPGVAAGFPFKGIPFAPLPPITAPVKGVPVKGVPFKGIPFKGVPCVPAKGVPFVDGFGAGLPFGMPGFGAPLGMPGFGGPLGMPGFGAPLGPEVAMPLGAAMPWCPGDLSASSHSSSYMPRATWPKRRKKRRHHEESFSLSLSLSESMR